MGWVCCRRFSYEVEVAGDVTLVVEVSLEDEVACATSVASLELIYEACLDEVGEQDDSVCVAQLT